jgi:hypothetical protein
MSQHLDGIQGFSKPTETLVIWAADYWHEPHAIRAYLTHHKINFMPCLGSYEGERELSFLTSLATWENDLCKLFCHDQESVLILGTKDSCNRHLATLRYLNGTHKGSEVPVGRFYSMPVAQAFKRRAYTIPLIQTTGEFLAFVCDPVDIHGKPIVSD